MLRILAIVYLLAATAPAVAGDRLGERYAWPVVGIRDGDTI